jgi:hypothetical protein
MYKLWYLNSNASPLILNLNNSPQHASMVSTSSTTTRAASVSKKVITRSPQTHTASKQQCNRRRKRSLRSFKMKIKFNGIEGNGLLEND